MTPCCEGELRNDQSVVPLVKLSLSVIGCLTRWLRANESFPAMSEVNLDVRYVADLARLRLSDEEIEQFSEQLLQVIEHMNQLREVDVSGVEPMAHAFPVFNVLRGDEVRDGLRQDEALSVAPRAASDLFMVTKVIE